MLGWKPAQATVVAKRFIQEIVGAFNEFIVDVQPAGGGAAFRTTLKERAFVLGEPEVGQVVPAFCKADKQKVRFDWAKLTAGAMADLSAEPAGWDATRKASPGTPVRSPESADASGTDASAPATAGAGRRGSAAELLATGQRMTAVLREFSPFGKTVGELDATLPDPNDPVYVFKAELSIDGSSPIAAVFINRVPEAKVASLHLGARLSVAVNPANPSHEVAVDWADSPLAD